jgi:predicted metal-dependent peptidase
MTSVVLGQDKEGKDVSMGYGALYKGDPKYKTTLYKFIDWYNGNDERGLPRHGIYSLTGRRVNTYIYDHPALLGKCSTAFTNGQSNFFSAPFFEQLLEARENKDGPSHSTLEFVMTHELDHMIRMHFSRLQSYRPEDSNIFADMVINLGIQRCFPNWSLPSDFTSPFIGFKPTDMKDYGHLSEETIARILIEKRNEILKEDDIDPNAATEQELDKAMAEAIGFEGGNEAGSENDHMMTMEEFVNTLSESGDEALLNELGLSGDMTKEEMADKLKNEAKKVENDVAEASSARRAHPNGSGMPGGHIEEEVSMRLTADRSAKLDWNLAIADMILGDGMKDQQIDDVPDELFYIEGDMMNMEHEIYLPGTITYQETSGMYLFILDTSGSVSDNLAKQLISEIHGLFSQNDMVDAKLIFMSADTVARGDLIEMNLDNYESILDDLETYGRGGTDLKKGLCEGMEKVAVEYPEEKLRGVIYATDLGDTPPARTSLPEELPPIVFITTEEYMSDRFTVGVSEYAKVVPMTSGNIISMNQEDKDEYTLENYSF